jgi:hypothetical protein
LTTPHRISPTSNSSQSRAEFLLRQSSLVRLNVEKQVTLEDADNQRSAANFSEPTPSGTRESKRAGSRPSLETGTKWFEIKRRNHRHIDREPSG